MTISDAVYALHLTGNGQVHSLQVVAQRTLADKLPSGQVERIERM